MALSDMKPPAAAAAFLNAHGWTGAEILPLAGDASFRRYFRVQDDTRAAVLMDAPPPHEDPRPFVAMAEYLNSIGLAAPQILARDLDQGLLLIEDFGDDRMREAVDANLAIEGDLYRDIAALLVELHRHPAPSHLRRHDLQSWLGEVELFIDWYGPTVGLELDRESFLDVWRGVLTPIIDDGEPWVTELRDFHAENVMLIPGKTGSKRFGLLDFQDALLGHPAYDLVSMLQDARRDVSPAVETAVLQYYAEQTHRSAAFENAYWGLGAQRNTRILGVFCRLWKRDTKPHYTTFQPRMWGLLERDLTHPSLVTVRDWFDSYVPQEKRAAFWTDIQL